MKFSSSGSSGGHSFSSGNARPSSTPSTSSGMRSTQQRSSSSGPRSSQQRSSTSSYSGSTQSTSNSSRQDYSSSQEHNQRSNINSTLTTIGAGLLGAFVGKKLSDRQHSTYSSGSTEYYDNSYSPTRESHRRSNKVSNFLTMILSLIVLVGLAWLIITYVVPLFQGDKSDTDKQQRTITGIEVTKMWEPVDYNTSGVTVGDYYLCNNTLKEAYTVPFTDDANKKSLKIKAFHSTDAEAVVDMRNAHFYDVIQLINKQGANPSNGIYEIEYIGVGENEDGGDDVEVIYFVLDENLLLDIQDGYISYTNLYEYCLDLQLHDALR